MRFNIEQGKRLFIIFADLIIIISSYIFAFLLRFELNIPSQFYSMLLKTLPLIIILRFACFWLFGLYKGMWQFASTDDLISIIKAASTSSVLIVLGLYFLNRFQGYPRSIFFIDWMLLVMLSGGFRFSIRLSKEIINQGPRVGKRVLIVGAGNAGEMILREMLRNHNHQYNPVGLVDDDPSKKGLRIHGVKVIGSREDIPEIAKRYNIEEIVISIPSATNKQIQEIIHQCSKSSARFKTVPALTEIIDGVARVNQIRDVQMEDLIGREPLEVDLRRIEKEILGKKVLVTGGGGSIGRELCRQISKFHPDKLLIYDHAENSVFYTERELLAEFPRLNCVPLVADISDRITASRIFKQHSPQIIFHAAAHKHVPLMEFNPIEAFRNNVIGTKIIAELAIENKADKFIFISTDKAVRPKNFMGATKRTGELYIEGLSRVNSTKFMSVRFGNVIGSTGSVVRLFKEQIQSGGPVTVTHPDIARFLMTIPEAVQLILQASSMGKGGEIFVLDMGEPIKIMELARTMIRLSGLKPERDIPITVIGLRPGEKLEEDLYDPEHEELKETEHKKIYIVEDQNHMDLDAVANIIKDFETSIQLSDENALISKFQHLIQSDFASA
jgi:FlaA1/EpsC-like NDP-sugar epimerase